MARSYDLVGGLEAGGRGVSLGPSKGKGEPLGVAMGDSVTTGVGRDVIWWPGLPSTRMGWYLNFNMQPTSAAVTVYTRGSPGSSTNSPQQWDTTQGQWRGMTAHNPPHLDQGPQAMVSPRRVLHQSRHPPH
jgi:hypothetical protein